MHQIRFRLGLCPRLRWGAYSAPPELDLRGSLVTSKGREGRKDGRNGPGREEKRGEGTHF